ncbi:MAG: hypothetical protein QOF10_2028 [Kribbellaceae bacterium]|nr:hypothetical protein [Kribbellaceae bacterium]
MGAEVAGAVGDDAPTVGRVVAGADTAGAAGTAAGGLVATLPTAGLKAAIAIVAPITHIIVGKFLNIANP